METKLVKSRRGHFFVIPHDTVIGRSLQTYGEYAEHEMMLLSHYIKSEQAVIDVGANIGTHSVFFSRQVGSKGKVLALEAQPEIFNILKQNLSQNDCKNVKALNTVVGDGRGEISFPPLDYSQEGNFGAFSFRVDNIGCFLPLDGRREQLKLPVIPLDDMNILNCNLLKVDAEGMEGEILSGAIQMLHKFRPLLYLENNSRPCSPALIEQVYSLDYKAYWHVISYYRPQNFARFPDNLFTAPLELNLFCVPNEKKFKNSGLPAVTGPDQWLPEEIELKKFEVDKLLLIAESFGFDR